MRRLLEKGSFDNHHSNDGFVGSTGKKICLVGDSAGANLAVSTALRAVHRGVRPPDGVLSIYGSFHVRYAPSPSRLMAILDPILPLGLLIKCLSGEEMMTLMM